MINNNTIQVTNNLFISFFTDDQVLNEMLYPQVLDESFGVIASVEEVSEAESDQEDLEELSDLYSSDSEEDEEVEQVVTSEFQTPPRPVTNLSVRLVRFDETIARAEHLQELVNISTIRRRLFN